MSASSRRCSCNYSWSCQQKIAAESEEMFLKGKTTGGSRNFVLEARDFMWLFSQVWAYVLYVMDGSDLGRWGHFPVKGSINVFSSKRLDGVVWSNITSTPLCTLSPTKTTVGLVFIASRGVRVFTLGKWFYHSFRTRRLVT